MRSPLKLAYTLLVTLLSHHAFAQCGANLPYTQWQPAGATGNDATWQHSGFTTLQTANPDPSFLVHPDSILNVRLTGTIRVTTSNDDDFIGFAIFTAGGMWLFDWKENAQSTSGYFADEGFTITFITGAIDFDDNSDFLPVLWGHSDARIAQIGTNYGSSLGWTINRHYNLTIIYTENRIMIEVDGQVVLDECRLNDPGLFAWYNFSQPGVEYSNFTCSGVSETFSSDLDTMICAGEQFFAGGQLRGSSGIYVDTFAAASGCDSTVTTYLTVTSCDDSDACTTDICSGGSCSYSPVVCDDLDACTNDTCLAAGGCNYTPFCDDLNACTTDACSGGICSYAPVGCDDLNACTTDTCSGGICGYGPAVCDDLNACTTDSCNGVQCVFTAITCDDADPCTADSCVNGTCVFPAITCDDSEVCTADTCEISGCVFTPVLIEAFISPPQDTITVGDTLVLSAGSLLTNPVYLWQSAESLSCYHCESPLATPLVSTGYLLIVTHVSGCSDTAQALITVEEYVCPEPFVPNAFTPNGDGKNDEFLVYGDIQEVQMQIFNPWGELVFESSGIGQGWNGTYGGKRLNPGVFVYVIEFCSGSKMLKGTVTLLR